MEVSRAMVEFELTRRGFEGVSAGHEGVIRVLAGREEPVPLRVIVEDVGKAKSTVTANVKTLEKYGYVIKKRNVKDSRSRLVSLTDRGRVLSSEYADIAFKIGDRMCEDLVESEKLFLGKVLKKIEDNLSREARM